jgi:hypothetical protein
LLPVLDWNVSNRVKLELTIWSGGGLILAGDGNGEFAVDETGEGCAESDSMSIWIVEGTTIEMLWRSEFSEWLVTFSTTIDGADKLPLWYSSELL